MIHNRYSHWLFAACLLTVAACATAQDGEPQSNGDATEVIQLSDLPDPPAEIAELIKVGKVTFSSGRKPWEEIRAARDRTGVTGSGRRLAAETKFSFVYDYRSSTRWRVRDAGDNQILTISISYKRASLEHDHKIWFRRPPPSDKFWSDKIVQHEFDHVRLSCNPIIAKRFLEKLRETKTLNETIPGNTKPTNAMVQRFVEKHVKEVFDEIVDLIAIRYKELDRETDHGLRPLPSDSKLKAWMQ